MSRLARKKIAPFSIVVAFWCVAGLALVSLGVKDARVWRFLVRRLA